VTSSKRAAAKKVKTYTAVAALLSCAALSGSSWAAGNSSSVTGKEWPYFGGSIAFDRYSPLSQINASNFDQVSVLWTRPAVDKSILDQFPDVSPSNYMKGTPIMIGGVLYASDGVGLVEAFDARTGATIWVQKPFAPTLKEAAGTSTRGVAAWNGDGHMRIISVRGEYLYALDAKNGSLITNFGDGGRVYLRRKTPDDAPFFGFNGPIIVGNVIVIGGNGGGKEGGGFADGGNAKEATPEDIRAFDVRTGKLVWTFHLMPAGTEGQKNWGASVSYTGNMAAWAPLTADPETGYVYVPTSSPTNSYYGGHRPGNNLYANSLIAINTKTGKEVWHYQLVHHDLWDYDIASPPTLGDIRVNGKLVKAIIAVDKTGRVFVFDRHNGKPVWPIEERPVPQSTIPGEYTSPTQPFPTKPKPFDQVGLEDSDLIDFTPTLREEARALRDKYLHGPMFMPPSVISEEVGGKQGTIAVPGDWGSANWNTGAFDPETGRYYAVSMTMPEVFALHKAMGPTATIAYMEGSETPRTPRQPRPQREAVNPYGFGPEGLPMTKPPYGRITAYDMNTGDQMWMAASGDGPRNHPLLQSLNLPPLGNIGRQVSLVTKSLLLVADSGDAVMGGFGVSGSAKLRAYDKATGRQISEIQLPAGATAGPMTYEANGKQVIVVSVGSRSHNGDWVALGLK
jgi:quinoprotein glucose dehydrogenase